MSYLHRTARPATFASVKIWRIYKELVVKDSPGTKLELFIDLTKLSFIFLSFLFLNSCYMYRYFSSNLKITANLHYIKKSGDSPDSD